MTGTDPIDPEIMDDLARMMAASTRRRADRAGRAWTTLRPYERRIVKEAAVMGYVLGYQHGNAAGYAEASRRDGSRTYADDFPRDKDIVTQVIQHCDGTDDLYPYLAAACDGRRRRITQARRYPGETR